MEEHPLKQIGEFGLIDRILSWFGAETTDLEGAGDDCTVLKRNGDSVDLVTTDLLIEETHFLFEKITPYQLGHKALAVNLSDIAAMGGRPKNVWLSIGLTTRADLNWLEDFFSGMKDLAHKYGVKLMGGDTTRSQNHLVINIMVTGEAAPDRVKFRSSARPDDIIFVTDPVGDSGGGLQLLLEGDLYTTDPDEQKLITAHNLPWPCVDEGVWLGQQPAVHALIDVSDGISSDAGHIANRSGVAMNIELSALPISSELRRVARKRNWDPVQLACSAGEDYVLMGTCAPAEWDTLSVQYRNVFDSDLHAVGTVRKVSGDGKKTHEKSAGLLRGGEVRFTRNGEPAEPGRPGFDHFRSA
ncbi:thiamine-phosphate kinase [Balneolales bacterium ANBcel1]|nr:thiamine-phosphate kinase [Balneolales bacterium ANBcel1]